MALKPAEKEFVDEGGARILVRTQQLPAIPALRLSARLGKILAPAMMRAEGAINDESDNLSALAPVFFEFFRQLNEQEIESLIISTFASTQAQISNGEKGDRLVPLATPGNVNSVFEGRLGDLVAAVWFVLEHNFGDFINAALQKLKARAAEAKAKAERASAKANPAASAE